MTKYYLGETSVYDLSLSRNSHNISIAVYYLIYIDTGNFIYNDLDMQQKQTFSMVAIELGILNEQVTNYSMMNLCNNYLPVQCVQNLIPNINHISQLAPYSVHKST